MRRSKGFTLYELMLVLVVVVVIFVLVSLQEPRHRSNCMSQLNGIAKGLAMYAQDNQGSYPMLPGRGWDTVPDGTGCLSNSDTAPYDPTTGAADWTDQRSVSSLLFLLIRDGQSSKMFCCPSDRSASPDPSTQSERGGQNMFNWDFSCGRVNGGKIGSARNLSYSYQCPLTRQGDQTYDGNGVPINADPSLVVVSDRTPVESATAPAGGAFTGASGSPGPWSTNIGSGDVHYYNSQNHDGGSLMNVLYADSHAAAVKTPNVGPAATGNASVCDCIFTNFGSAGPNPANPPDGVDFGGKLGNATHTGNRDTYLWGGAGKAVVGERAGKNPQELTLRAAVLCSCGLLVARMCGDPPRPPPPGAAGKAGRRVTRRVPGATAMFA